MEAYQLDHFTFSYPGQIIPALQDINLTIQPGEFILLCGPSGSGKTTLLRHLKKALSPHGLCIGTINRKGIPIELLDERTEISEVGLVMQSPENQIVTDTVWHELAFGLESLGIENRVMREKVDKAARGFALEDQLYKKVYQLSGGQKQLLNLAAVMAMQPEVLLLDEPTGQLDPTHASSFFKTLQEINQHNKVTVVLSEHRVEEVYALASRVIIMDRGEIVADGTPYEVGKALKQAPFYIFSQLPTTLKVYARVNHDVCCPVTLTEGKEWLEDFAAKKSLGILSSAKPLASAALAIELRDVWFGYDQTKKVIQGLSWSVPQGNLVALLGENGTGKTTLLSLITGAYSADRGEVKILGNQFSNGVFRGLLGVLPQNPKLLFMENTLELDLWEMLEDTGLSTEEKRVRIREISELCKLENLLYSHPFDLSGGEQQRAALAKILLLEPQILLLDEPTKGLDGFFKQILAAILQDLKQKGTTILLVSHDIEFCAQVADWCAALSGGKIIEEGPPQDFFGVNGYYPTAAARMSENILPQAVTAEDIILACGGSITSSNVTEGLIADQHEPFVEILTPSDITCRDSSPNPRTYDPRLFLILTLMVGLISLTIWAGTLWLDDRKYHFVSSLVILEAILLWVFLWEKNRPKVQEVILIALLCALAVAGRAVFFGVPQFKPVVAVIIIAGVALGGQAGFLTGTLTAFVSNFYFGQGPWTAWQMLALGMIGFLAGLIFYRRPMLCSRFLLCIFGIFVTIVVYGGIVNAASVLITQPTPVVGMFVTAYAMGLPMDLLHAFATAFFLWLLAPTILSKLERMQTKYGEI